MVQAAADGLVKAKLLAEASGAKVGPIEAISERGNKDMECKNAAGESAPYKGVAPDSGTAESPTLAVRPAVAPVPPKAPKPAPSKKKKKKRKATERRADRVIARMAENVAVSCELTTEVSLIYNLAR